MSVKNFAEQMKATILYIKSQGTAAIFCDNIVAYLDGVINSPQPAPTVADIERYKAEMQSRIEFNKHTHESNLESFKAVISAGQSAIKASLLLNGGAAVALLTFISHLATIKPEKVSQFAPSIVPFAFGALAIVVTAGLTYLSQWFYASPKTNKLGFFANIACIALGITSYASFVWGLIRTYCLLINFTV
jgi:hypothetical protein